MDRMTELSEKWKASALSLGEAEELIALFVASRDGVLRCAHHAYQAREYLLMTPLHFDESAVGAEHLMHYIRMANAQIEKAISCVPE